MPQLARRTGRATKLTAAVHQAIVEAVSLGVPLVSAGQYAGVAPSTLYEWLARGTGRLPPRSATRAYTEFADAIEKAKAADEVRRLTRLDEAARGGQVVYEKTTTYPDGRVVREVRRTRPEWTADAWVVERSRPEQWGRRERVDMHVQVQQAAALVAEECGLTVEEVLEEAAALLQRVDRHGA